MTRSAGLRDCVCTRDIVILRAADMDGWKDELASWQMSSLHQAIGAEKDMVRVL